MDHEHCEACGFDGGVYDDASLLDALRALGPRWQALLGAAGPELRQRPEPEVWSALEYAAHSRDITEIHVFGVEQALTNDEPAFGNIDAGLVDAVAVDYNASDPDVVGGELTRASARLAQIAGDAGPDAWSRGLTVGGDRLDVRRLLEHALHDSLHHVDDVERGFARLRA